MRVLVIEDDPTMNDVLRSQISGAGFVVDTASDGEAGCTLARGNDYDLIVLDLNLPDMAGEEVLALIREKKHVPPVLMLSVVSTTETKVRLLNAGADDYLIKPFSSEELIARIRALLRRPPVSLDDTLVSEDLTVDMQRQMVFRSGKEISLTPKEFMLLAFLIRHKGSVVSKQTLIERVWDENANPFSNAIETHMGNVRKKLGVPEIIHTVRGRGYRIG